MICLSVNLLSRWWSRETSDVRKEAIQRHVPGVNLLSGRVPVDPQKCLRCHVCLLPQVATGEAQLAVPMERRRSPNKRRKEKKNQLNLHWPSEKKKEKRRIYLQTRFKMKLQRNGGNFWWFSQVWLRCPLKWVQKNFTWSKSNDGILAPHHLAQLYGVVLRPKLRLLHTQR